MREITVTFSGDADQEMNRLVADLGLVPLANWLGENRTNVPIELQGMLGQLLSAVLDIFSVSLPEVLADPEQTLRTISRDINLARILRERGLFRLYLLTRTLDGNGVPVFMGMVNPLTGSPFSRQEEFLGWFCEEAHVARSLAFQRLATIERLLTLGYTLESAFQLIIKKPYAIRETLNAIAEWQGGEIVDLSSTVVSNLADRMADPDERMEIKALAEKAAAGDEDAKERLIDAFKPMAAKLLQEVGDIERSKDALDFVKHDVLIQPEIKYSWDQAMGALVVEYIEKEVDQDTGEMWTRPPQVIPFVPDVVYLPEQVKDDLLRRLPIRSRLDV